MTRKTTRLWPWFAAFTLALTGPALADEAIPIHDLFEPEQVVPLELVEDLIQIEEVVFAHELEAGGPELRPMELDDAFWEDNAAFDVTVHYSEEEPEQFHEESDDGGPEFEVFEAEFLDAGPSWAELIEIAQMWLDYLAKTEAEKQALLHHPSLDSDGDGLTNLQETAWTGTDPFDKDSDDDGWMDGPANLRYRLVLLEMTRWDDPWTPQCAGDDDIYFIVDDARWPQAAATYGNAAINGEWTLPDEETIALNTVVQERVMPLNGPTKMVSQISIWDDDAEIGYLDDWYEDDHYFSFEVDLLKATVDVPFTVQLNNSCGEYTVKMVVYTSAFSDPDPLDGGSGDFDGDALSDLSEARLARVFGGMSDPLTEDLWIEIDHAADVGGLRSKPRYMVVSQFKRHGINLRIDAGRFGGGTSIPHTGELYEADLESVRNANFTSWRVGLFRYSLFVDQLWTGRSGKRMGDTVLVDGNRYWHDVWNTAQAGTFIHELGHALNLNFWLYPKSYIDMGWDYDEDRGVFGGDQCSNYYYSSMNYKFQYSLVDYSEGDDPSCNDVPEWAVLDLGFDLPLQMMQGYVFIP